jgi:sugar phosphate isomerase/epimerase
MTPLPSRRAFLKNSIQSGLALASITSLENFARAIEPINRPGSSRFRVSLVAYSFRDLFNARDPAKKMDLFRYIDVAAEQGFDGVEITQYYFPKEVTDEYLISLRRHCFLRGVSVSGSGIGNNFALPKGEKLDEQIRDVKRRVEYAQILGAPFVRVFSGGLRNGATLNEMEARSSVVSALEDCADYAGKKGVFLGLENDGGLTTNVEGTLALIKAVNSKWLGSNLDTGNFTATDDVYGDLAKLAPYAINVHFKSEIRPRGKSQPMDIPRILSMLQAVNYQGFLGIEFEATEDPLHGVPVLLKKMRAAMQSI